MPTFQSQSFNCLVADSLATLELGLAERCEALAKEREKTLQQQIEQLRKENDELRSRLQAEDKPSTIEPKLVEDPRHLGPGAKPSSKGALAASAGDVIPESYNVEGKASRPRAWTEGQKDSKPLELDDLISPSNIRPARSESMILRDPESGIGVTTGPFTLLAELQGDPWTGDDVNDDHNGAYFEREGVIEQLVKRRCVMDPSSELKLTWDILGIPILAWDVITIPMVMSKFAFGGQGEDILGIAGWVTMMYWTIDMPVTFLTGFFSGDGELIMDRKRIAKHYVVGAFWLDLLIISADWVIVLIEAIGSSAPGFLSNLGVLRALRISRFARLMRLRKLKAKWQTVEDSIDNEWLLVVLNLFAKVLSILVVNHYIACGWYGLGSAEGIDDAPYRWLTAVPWPQYDYRELGNQKISDSTWDFQYLSSLHWAIAQFTPGPQNIQPQNSYERLYAVCVLLFGIVVFSSFIASVTQARLQLNKMMSKFERDNWIMRKFCRQHNISRELQTHMRRYVDLVIIPNYHKLTRADVILFPMLSQHLRHQLTTELMAQHLVVHPFFKKLSSTCQPVMNNICNEALEQTSYAQGDVAFSGGVKARSMLFVTSGVMDYIPISKHGQEQSLPKGSWCSEAALWTKWTHQGQLQASIETAAVRINAIKFRAGIQENGFVMNLVQTYGLGFCEGLTKLWETQGMPTDLHQQIAVDVDIGPQSLISFMQDAISWNGGLSSPGSSAHGGNRA